MVASYIASSPIGLYLATSYSYFVATHIQQIKVASVLYFYNYVPSQTTRGVATYVASYIDYS